MLHALAYLFHPNRYGGTEHSRSDVGWLAVARRIVSAKYKAYFHFRSIKSFSVIPLFRFSVFRVLPTPIVIGCSSATNVKLVVSLYVTFTFSAQTDATPTLIN